MGLSRTISEINSDFGRKSHNSPTPVYLATQLRGPLEFCNGGSAQKPVSCPYQMVERVWRYVHKFI